MKTVKVTPDNIISAIDVNFDDFRDLQKAVGGHFEIVSTKTLYETFKMPVIMLVDEDGIMKQKEVNRLGSYFSDGIPENEFFVLKRRIKNACEKKYRKRRNHKGTRII